MNKIIYRTEFLKMIKDDFIRSVEGFDKKYYVSRKGDVFSMISYLNTGKIKVLKRYVKKSGYVEINLFFQGKAKSCRVHRLVAEAFLPNPNNYPVINHKDEIKSNNNLSNLEWCTDKYNLNYGTCQVSKSKKVRQMDIYWNEIKVWGSIAEAERNGYTGDLISRCAKGKIKLYKRCRWVYL